MSFLPFHCWLFKDRYFPYHSSYSGPEILECNGIPKGIYDNQGCSQNHC